MKQKYYIDLHKGATFLYILLLIFMNDFVVTNINAYVYLALHGTYGILWILKSNIPYVYLALHGTYGILWILKSNIFPDRQWETKCSIWYGLLIWFGLSLYWIAPYIIITNAIESSNWYIAFCISIYIFGIFFHFTSDMQKFVQLNHNPNNLITDVMFSKIRNINYLGELFIYLGFSLLAMHPLPIIALLSFVIIIWIPNMIRKDKSLSRYNNFKEYKKTTNSLFPFIW